MTQKHKGYDIEDDVKMEAIKYLADTSEDKILELTAITRNSSMNIACMIAQNDLRDRLIAVSAIEQINDKAEKAGEKPVISPELEKIAQPFFLNKRILKYFFRLQRSVGGYTMGEMFKIAQTQVESEIEPDMLDNADNQLFGDK